jgi:hypothetical protein
MRKFVSRRAFLLVGLASGICGSAGCGTILYPERRGQPAGTLDCGVILLDGLGLLLFFLPGVIAFAVDFSTGAIYLPEGESQFFSSAVGKHERLQKISVPTNQLSRAEIAEAVSRQTGKTVKLEEGKYRRAEIASIDEFWPATEKLQKAERAKS